MDGRRTDFQDIWKEGLTGKRQKQIKPRKN
jgi:hypothetical protein